MSVASLCARRGRDKLVRVHHTNFSVARICDAQIAALSAAQRRCSKLPSIQAWIGPARAWPIVPNRKLNVVHASRTIDKCFGRVLQALQASQGAGFEIWSMYARLAPRSQCMAACAPPDDSQPPSRRFLVGPFIAECNGNAHSSRARHNPFNGRPRRRAQSTILPD